MTGRRLTLVYALVVGLVQVGLMVAVWIPAPHNGGDNAGYVALAHALVEGIGYVEAWDATLPAHTKYPPVFPALLALPIVLGARTWTALKLVPALATVAATVLAFLWVARRRTPGFGAGVALLLALAPGLLWYSHWVLSDVPFLAFTLLCLYALERGSDPDTDEPPDADEPPDGASALWIAVGLAGAILAFFTRSAGLPLVVAVAGWLVLRRRWRSLAAFAVVGGLPAVAWWLRSARASEAGYVGEFWMVDPYAPEMGTVGLAGLLGRAVENAGLYTARHLPEGLVGVSGTPGGAVALALLLLAALGWAMRFGAGSAAGGPLARLRDVHVAELFFPLYAGLILLWPTVWSGDRFALPLFPLILFYAGDGLFRLVGRGSRAAAPWVVAGVAVLLALPAVGQWTESGEYARACAEATRGPRGGPYACYGAPWQGFVQVAAWSGANLPEGSAVLTRKPRIFYVMGGVPGRTYPYVTDPEAFLATARDAGAQYVLLDNLDRQGMTYVGGVVTASPGAFCTVEAFADGTATGARLLGIVDPTRGVGGQRVEGPEGPSLRIPRCPPDLLPPAPPTPTPPPRSLQIPLLSEGGTG